MVTQTKQTKLKQGYQQTELGVVPEDWEVKTFKDVCLVNQGLQIAISNRHKNPSSKSKKYITIQYLNDGKEIEYIDDYSASVCCEKEDILMTRTGNTGIVVSDVEGVFHNNFFKINYNKKILDRKYLIYFLNQEKIQKILLIKAGTSTIPDLNHNDFYSILIIYPKPEEQSAIASILSDIDTLLNSLNKIITKKKNIKNGTMQEFLTGKRRLPGFNEKWEYRTFDELFTFLSTGTNPRSDLADHGDVQYVHYGDVHTKWNPILDCNLEEIPYIKKDKVKGLPRLQEGDLIIVDASEDYVGVGVSALVKNVKNKQIVSGLHTILLRSHNGKIAQNFKAYLTSINSVKSQMIKIVTGISVYGLSKTNLKKIKIFLPNDIEEQSAMAQIVSDMDYEITELEKKRDKYLMIKNGMMQELLTGKIRIR